MDFFFLFLFSFYFVVLASGIKYLSDLRRLNLARNAITHVGLETITASLPRLSRLRRLNLRANGFFLSADTPSSLLSRFSSASLTHLSLGENFISKEDMFLALIRSFPHLPSLQSLTLSANGCNDECIGILSPALRGLQYLTFLDLSWNFIGDESLEFLIENFLCFTSRLQYLSLDGTAIGDSFFSPARLSSASFRTAFLPLCGFGLISTDVSRPTVARLHHAFPQLRMTNQYITVEDYFREVAIAEAAEQWDHSHTDE